MCGNSWTRSKPHWKGFSSLTFLAKVPQCNYYRVGNCSVNQGILIHVPSQNILALSSGPVKAQRPFPHYCYLSSCSVSFSFFLNLAHFTCGLIMWRKTWLFWQFPLGKSLSSLLQPLRSAFHTLWIFHNFSPGGYGSLLLLTFSSRKFFQGNLLILFTRLFVLHFPFGLCFCLLYPEFFHGVSPRKLGSLHCPAHQISLHKSSQSLAPSAP